VAAAPCVAATALALGSSDAVGCHAAIHPSGDDRACACADDVCVLPLLAMMAKIADNRIACAMFPALIVLCRCRRPIRHDVGEQFGREHGRVRKCCSAARASCEGIE
jgi:hypothetical protein